MPSKSARKKPPTGKHLEFAATFAALREILTPYAAQGMRVVQDKPGYYYLETNFSVMGRGPVMFAAVRTGKGYVSYHLLPIYMNPSLQDRISTELKKRKQGKACFNFVKPDEKLFAEISELTRLALESFKKLSTKAESFR